MADIGTVAVQCAKLSRKGGGLPAAILPVVSRLTSACALVSQDMPEDYNLPKTVKHHLALAGPLHHNDVSLVHTHGLWSSLSLAALRWRRRTRGPTIVSPHGMLDPWALAQGKLKKKLAMALVERAHLNGSVAVHALTIAEHDALRALGITAPIAIIPNGVDPVVATPPPPLTWMDRPTLLFLGRLHEKKGVAGLIAAWALAQDHLPGWQLAIAGWDDGPNEFRQLAAQTGSGIVFPGPLFGADKVAALAHCKAFILPSFSEGLPMTVLEAWAHGKPVFMTEACNLPEGFLHRAAVKITTNPDGMAVVLRRHLADVAILDQTGQAGRALAARDFSWDAVAARFRNLYAFAQGQGDAPADLMRVEA